MRFIATVSLLLAFILASCAPAAQPVPTITASPVPSETLSPTQTFTPEPTATVTPPVIPDYMNEYIERGLDSLSSDTFLCYVIDESKIHYSPLGGVIYKERRILSWVEVDYILDGELRHGIVLIYLSRGGSGIHQDFNKFMFSNSGQSGSTGTVAYVEAVHKAWVELTPEEHVIACGILGLIMPSEMPVVAGMDFQPFSQVDFEAQGVNLLYDGVFPVEDGKAHSVTITGIGEVLPVTQSFTIRDLLVEQK